jgi:hypothetical protein
MKYMLTLAAVLSILSTSDASSIRRKRASDGFMGAPSRKANRHHANAKEVATEIAGATATGVGKDAIENIKRNRNKEYSPVYPN